MFVTNKANSIYCPIKFTFPFFQLQIIQIHFNFNRCNNSSCCVYFFFFFFCRSCPFCRLQFECCKIFRNPIQRSILLVRSKTISFVAWIFNKSLLSEYCKYSVIRSFIIRTSCFAMSFPLKRKCCAQIRL